MTIINYIEKYNNISQAHKLAVDCWALSQGYTMYVRMCDREETEPVTEEVYNNIVSNCSHQLIMERD